MLRILAGALALLLAAHASYYLVQAHATAGVLMMFAVSALLGLWCAFWHPVNVFLSHGAGLWLRGLLLAGVVLYAGIAFFLACGFGCTAADGTEQAVLVLGAGLNGNEVSDTLRRRLDAACVFYRKAPSVPIVVTGGQGPREGRTEASAMKEYLVLKGIPADRIYLEDRSTSTRENVLFAQEVLEKAGFGKVQRVVLVTNRFHCYRASLITRRLGLDPHVVAASLNPFDATACYLREVLAALYYWLLTA